jgi:hypothetical protein
LLLKNTLILALLASTITFAALTVFQWRKTGEARVQTAAVRSQLDQKDQKIEALQSAQQRSEEQRRELLRASDELSAQVRALRTPEPKPQPQPATAPAVSPEGEPMAEKGKAGGFGKMISNMLQDPEMKKFVRDQQRAMLDPLYSPLIKQMGLSPEEAEKFKDLLSDNMMKSTEKASSIFAAGTNHAALMANLTADQANFEEQVKSFLGESRYGQYKDYQETVGERTQLNMFKQQNAASDYPLSEMQMEQILVFMKEEKKSAGNSALSGFGSPGNNPANFQAMLSSDQTDKLLQSQEAINQRVYERARTVLSPQQMEDFGKFQANQMQTMRMGLSMARKMFAPEKGE